MKKEILKMSKALLPKLSAIQKFYFVLGFFVISFFIMGTYLFQQMRANNHYINLQIVANRFELHLNKLAENIRMHQILSNRFILNGNISKNQLTELEAEIINQFQELKFVDQLFLKELSSSERRDLYPIEEQVSIIEMEQQWSTLMQYHNSNITKINQLHEAIINDIRVWRDFIDYSFNFIVEGDNPAFRIINHAYTRLSDTRDLVTESIITFIRLSVSENPKEYEFTQKHLIEDLKRVTKEEEKISQRFSTLARTYEEVSPQLQNVNIGLRVYVDALHSFVKEAENFGDKPSTNADKAIQKGIDSLRANYALANAINNARTALLSDHLKNLLRIQYVVFGSTLIIGLIGSFLGWFFVHAFNQSVANISIVAHKLASGDLTARVPVESHDEIGQASVSFNRMAESFQKIITQLRDFQEAIKKLSKGDFSARVEFGPDTDEDIYKVSNSFNNMAQSFEDIVGQLHNLGINLTTSATEIAAASRQQETIIVEQEATTREISVTANEISATAKEFATTVNEISKVAEFTSGLAATGKDSLEEMERILRQMVTASGEIASKLAVLNEKAANITSVITTITRVADHTNLLSLNAAIEAEKAGEFGRSFAVIAREIRRLADLTAVATLDIEKIITEIMSAVSSSVMGVEDFTQGIRNGVGQVSKVGEQLSTIMERVQDLTVRFETVNQGMQSQTVAADQINEALTLLSHTARMTTESIGQFRNTIEQLNLAATDLRVAVSKIRK
jgi:methyl-accepting chemotaxis protein